MVDVLVVEDSPVLATLINRKMRANLNFRPVIASSYHEAQEIIQSGSYQFFLALLDLILPDAPGGKIVDFIKEQGIPIIVFTSEISDDVREFIQAKNVVDYVVKQSVQNLDYIVNLVDRMYKNQFVKVLVVDDSRISRRLMRDALEFYKYQVLEADDGQMALDTLNQHPDIKLVITDYHMPKIDGFELVSQIRAHLKRDKNELAIIGLSAYGHQLLSARFIKNGANDFLLKPFLKEEFICRVNQNVEYIEHIARINNLATRDYLTGLFNRRYFFDVGRTLFENARRQHLVLTVAMVDIDYFKNVNDQYGHDAGDHVLKTVADLLRTSFRSADIVARMGGEEFCVLAANIKPEALQTTFDRFRLAVANARITHESQTIHITVSIGVAVTFRESLEAMINKADQLLYQAKENGRNRVALET